MTNCLPYREYSAGSSVDKCPVSTSSDAAVVVVVVVVLGRVCRARSSASRRSHSAICRTTSASSSVVTGSGAVWGVYVRRRGEVGCVIADRVGVGVGVDVDEEGRRRNMKPDG